MAKKRNNGKIGSRNSQIKPRYYNTEVFNHDDLVQIEDQLDDVIEASKAQQKLDEQKRKEEEEALMQSILEQSKLDDKKPDLNED